MKFVILGVLDILDVLGVLDILDFLDFLDVLGVLGVLDLLDILDLWGSLFYIDFEGVDAAVVVESQDVHAALEGSWELYCG